jgi:hypothetical protein
MTKLVLPEIMNTCSSPAQWPLDRLHHPAGKVTALGAVCKQKLHEHTAEYAAPDACHVADVQMHLARGPCSG